MILVHLLSTSCSSDQLYNQPKAGVIKLLHLELAVSLLLPTSIVLSRFVCMHRDCFFSIPDISNSASCNRESHPLHCGWLELAVLGSGRAGKLARQKGGPIKRALWSSVYLRMCFPSLNNDFSPADTRVNSKMSRALSVPYGNVSPDPYWGPQTSAVK